jgi:hypothetical protein
VGHSLRRELPDHPATANYVLEFHGTDGVPGH